ncbi:MAG: TIGR00341 family protein [Deltaproteobacteria bacterium]|nr:MAG: TIGR00341 family protein [Deltaproteobacteria bacterium]
MAQRLLKIILPAVHQKQAFDLLDQQEEINFWQEESTQGQFVASVLMDSGLSETVMDVFERTFSYLDGFRLVLLPVEATVPRIENQAPPPDTTEEPDSQKKIDTKRISREELYAKIVDSTRLSNVYLALALLSTVVAAIGLLKNNVAVIIGAMVIAPFLGPNVALALSTTLADSKLGTSAMKTLMAGLLIVLPLSAGMGYVLDASPHIPEIAARTRTGISDLILALASGAAGVLAFTTGISSALIGVMVAVALLPPLTVCGLLLGGGHYPQSFSAFLLFVANIICINFAGVVTFFMQGISPRTWWEAKKAKKATRKAILIWAAVFIVLVVIILL